MILVRSVPALRDAVRDARARGDRIGLVPTMGAFHDGHLALMRRARAQCGFVVVSLFVNPTQFNELADLDRYPRDEARDLTLAGTTGVDVVFAPPVEEVYPIGFETVVDVAVLSEPLEGVVRGPKHFRGVATVVSKLLNMAQPDDVFFGQKDAQQALIIRRLVRDLDLPVRVEICPTVREADGLAMSSRNALLDSESRHRASALSRALFAVEAVIAGGETSTTRALDAGHAVLAEERIVPEYFTIVSAESLVPLQTITGDMLIPIAARFGSVRLIDNVLVSNTGGA
ncbi:MAG: pantoate--beta-alanine ligase [bacterium]